MDIPNAITWWTSPDILSDDTIYTKEPNDLTAYILTSTYGSFNKFP